MPQSLNLADVSFDAHILEDVDRQVYYFRLLQLHVSYFAIFSC
jgi:hypothetical protein